MSGYHAKVSTWNENKEQGRKTLLSFTYPERIRHHYYYKRKYRITIKYLSEDGREKYKTVYFGHDNPVEKKPSHYDIFHPYFWEEKLLKKNETFEESFIRAVNELLPKKEILLEKK